MFGLTTPLQASPTEVGDTLLSRYLDGDSHRPIALALSGGGDSIALLIVAARWAASHGRSLVALTVDHGLNSHSQDWTNFAKAAALRAGVPWRGLIWTGSKPERGLPAAARAARHRLLADAARHSDASVLLVGHTADDVAEGDWMRERGAPTLGRLQSWSPSPAWPEGRGIFILRPFLTIRRASLRAWLADQAALWIEDPANDDRRFARSRARAALSLSARAPLLQPPTEPWVTVPWMTAVRPMARRVGTSPEGGFQIGRADWPSDPPAVRRLLAVAVACAAGTLSPARSPPVDRLARLCRSQGAFVTTLGGARISAEGGRVQIGREPGEFARRPPPSIHVSPGSQVVWDGRFLVQAHDTGVIMPLRGRAARLNRGDRSTLSAIPSSLRGTLPVLEIKGDLQLPAPWGQGPAKTLCLSAARFRAACGLIADEQEISKDHMAEGRQSSYVEDLALA